MRTCPELRLSLSQSHLARLCFHPVARPTRRLQPRPLLTETTPGHLTTVNRPANIWPAKHFANISQCEIFTLNPADFLTTFFTEPFNLSLSRLHCAMFSETVNYTSGRDNALDQHQSKELGRYITASRKKNLVVHSLLHNRCKFCINSFSSTGCRNCCLPVSLFS